MIEIKEALPNELNIISNIARKTWPETYGGIISPAQLEFMLDQFYSDEALNENLRNGHHFIIANEDGKPLGFASYCHDYPENGTTKIPKIYMLPESQGKGIGKTLIAEIIEISRKHGAEKLTLNVNRFNKALTFYQHLGFEIASEIDIEIGRGYLMEDYIMEKKLR